MVPEDGATWQLAVELHGCGIQGSPFEVMVKRPLPIDCLKFTTSGTITAEAVDQSTTTLTFSGSGHTPIVADGLLPPRASWKRTV